MKVLRPFDYSLDGIHARHLEPGDDPSGVPAEYVAGLLAEGYLGEGGRETKVEPALETGAASPIDPAGDDKPDGSRKGGPRRKRASDAEG